MLRDLVLALRPGWEPLGQLMSIRETVEWFGQNPSPDIVFMDIELADGNCFSIFNQITIPCGIIFTTAYSEFALRAFEQNSIDYLMKPVKTRDLERAIGKLELIWAPGTDNAEPVFDYRHLASLINQPTVYRQRFLISKRDAFYKLDANDIAAIYFDSRITFAVSFDGQHHILSQSLDKTEQELDPAVFFRANRQTILNIDSVDRFEVYFGGKLAVKLKVDLGDKVIISQAKASAFKNWLNS